MFLNKMKLRNWIKFDKGFYYNRDTGVTSTKLGKIDKNVFKIKGWKPIKSDTNNQIFFFNSDLNVNTWRRPEKVTLKPKKRKLENWFSYSGNSCWIDSALICLFASPDSVTEYILNHKPTTIEAFRLQKVLLDINSFLFTKGASKNISALGIRRRLGDLFPTMKYAMKNRAQWDSSELVLKILNTFPKVEKSSVNRRVMWVSEDRKKWVYRSDEWTSGLTQIYYKLDSNLSIGEFVKESQKTIIKDEKLRLEMVSEPEKIYKTFNHKAELFENKYGFFLFVRIRREAYADYMECPVCANRISFEKWKTLDKNLRCDEIEEENGLSTSSSSVPSSSTEEESETTEWVSETDESSSVEWVSGTEECDSLLKDYNRPVLYSNEKVKDIEEFVQIGSHKYRFKSCICYSGTVSSGHYTGFFLNDEKWCYYDDMSGIQTFDSFEEAKKYNDEFILSHCVFLRYSLMGEVTVWGNQPII